MDKLESEFTVIGAGMVGVCCALYLQKEGFKVSLVDKGAPGEAASFGNLGIIGIGSCPPLALPGILRQVPGMLLDPGAPLKFRWRDFPGTLPWLLRLLPESRRERVEEIASRRQSLLSKVHEALDPLVSESGANDLMRKTGLLITFESDAAFENASYALDLRRRNGVEIEVLDGDETRQFEPSLSGSVVRSWRIPELVHVRDPGALVKKFADLFAARGGTIRKGEITGFAMGARGVEALRTRDGLTEVGNVVLAAGAWSRNLAKLLGSSLPLVAERGYHTVFLDAEPNIRVPIISSERKLAVTPMSNGVRAGGFSEFANPDAPPDMRHAQRARLHAEAMFPELRSARRSEWMGPRPAFPDSIPVIARSPRCRNAWFAFGHDHIGLTLGAITGKLISEMAAGKPTTVDVSPFAPGRFRGLRI